MNKKFHKKENSRFYFVNEIKIMPKSKRSQVTIFIILALAILVVLILLFINRNNVSVVQGQATPIAQIKTCINDAAKEAMNNLGMQGGGSNPEPYVMYNGSKIQYLCYSSQYYQPCVVQKPLLKHGFEKELKQQIEEKAVGCVNAIKDSLKNKGYDVSSKKANLSVELVMNSVVVSLDDINLVISKSNTESYKDIKTETSSSYYQMIMIANSIMNYESHYGDSDTMGYMINYPMIKVEKKTLGDGTRIYILSDKETKERFMFASRSYALAAGVTGE